MEVITGGMRKSKFPLATTSFNKDAKNMTKCGKRMTAKRTQIDKKKSRKKRGKKRNMIKINNVIK